MKTVQTPEINPELKFSPPKPEVVAPPAVYQYSMQNELNLKSNRSDLFRSAWQDENKKRKHINNSLKLLYDITKATLGVAFVYGLFRYRKSIPLIKKMFKTATEKPAPNFIQDISNLYKYIMKK